MSTPTETSPTQQHIDEVVESLERSFTLLKRRTRDVLKLAHEREELMAAIENRPSRVAPAPIEVDDATAIHGVSATPQPIVESPPERSTVEPAAATPSVPEISEATAPPEVATPPVAPTEISQPETAAVGPQSDELPPQAAIEPVSVVDEPPAPAAEVTGKWAQRAPVEDSHDEAVIADMEPAEAAEPFEPSVASPETARQYVDEGHDLEGQHGQPGDATPAWEKPDLEWSNEAPAAVAPREFPHPMPPVDPAFLEPTDTAEAAEAVGPETVAHEWDEPDHDVRRVVDETPPHEHSDHSPFAAEFEEHVEEVGGSLESSPFDLDTPPQPASYRPRSLQSDRERDVVAASSLVDRTAEPADDDQSVEHVEAAWDDFAGDGTSGATEPRGEVPESSAEFEPSDPAPAPAASGSRLRDLVAQAREAEQVRAEQQKSDFDLINEDATVSRYDKNSAKLPTVGISSEELSSSVASLRSSFTSDKKSGSSDGGGSSRADKKAEKRAAKEAAKAAKTEAKRNRKQRN